MEQITNLCVFLFLLISCNNEGKPTDIVSISEDTKKTEITTNESITSIKEKARKGIGTYQGELSGNVVYMTISYCNGEKVTGYNTVRGLRRNFKGTISRRDDGWLLSIKEPGDNSFDGKYEILFDNNFNLGAVLWSPISNTSLERAKFSFVRSDDMSDDIEPDTFEYANENHNIVFNADGSCLFEYSDDDSGNSHDDNENAETNKNSKKIKGRWTKKGNKYIVNWDSNKYFMAGQTVFVKSDDESKISGDGLELYSDFM